MSTVEHLGTTEDDPYANFEVDPKDPKPITNGGHSASTYHEVPHHASYGEDSAAYDVVSDGPTVAHASHSMPMPMQMAQPEWLIQLDPERTYKIPLSKFINDTRLPTAITLKAFNKHCQNFALKLALQGAVNTILTDDDSKGTILFCGENCQKFKDYYPLIAATEKVAFAVPSHDVMDYQHKQMMVSHSEAPELNIDDLLATSNAYVGPGGVPMMQVPVPFLQVFQYVLEEKNHVLPPGQMRDSLDKNNPDYFLINKDVFLATVDLYRRRDGENAKTKENLQNLNMIVSCVNIGPNYEKSGPTVMLGMRF